MAQSTINLYNGLEALYYFGEERFDGSEIKDRSGYGRHATASGGPSLSENGYRNFGAATFDGSDDRFEVDDALSSDNTNTFAALVKPQTADGSENNIFRNADGTGGIAIRFRNNEYEATFHPDGDFTFLSSGEAAFNKDEWAVIVFRITDSVAQLFVDATLTTQVASGTITASTRNAKIGYDGTDGFLNAELAWVGKWSRALSDAEIDHLNRLTGPREARV